MKKGILFFRSGQCALYIWMLGIIIGIPGASSAQTILSKWTFESLSVLSPATANTPSLSSHVADAGSLTTASYCSAYHTDAGSVWSLPAGNGSSRALSGNHWGISDYFQFQFSTTSYNHIYITWDQTGSSTGPRDFKVQYSTDGITFSDAGGTNSSYQVVAKSWASSSASLASRRTVDLGNVTALNNQPTVFIRLIVTSNVSIGGGTIGTTGSGRVDNFTVLSALTSAPSDYYRTQASGSWNDVNTWQSSADNINWTNSTLLPDASSAGISIQPGHTVNVTEDITIDQTTIQTGGIVNVAAGKTISFNNGAGDEITISGSLVLKSDVSGDARLDNLSGGSVSGNVTVERFIPAAGNRAWRLLCAPLQSSGAPYIYNSWQEGGATAGTGTHITQAGGAATNGFDGSSIANSTSILYWDGTALQSLTNTNATKVSDHGGACFLFVRGDRTINLTDNAASGNTTLRATGAVNQGNVTAGIPGSSFSLIPNPYPSPIDFELVRNANGSSINTFYVWDATLNNVGAYRTITRTAANTYQQTPSGGSVIADNTAQFIRSGQAFFIPANTALNFTEDMKTDQVPTNFNVFRNTNGQEELAVNLNIITSGGDLLADGIRIMYDTGYVQSPGAEDVLKLNNFYENLGIANEGNNLAIDKRPFVTGRDTIALKIWNTAIRQYRFDFNPGNFSSGLAAYLLDNYTGTVMAIDLNTVTHYSFTITSDVNSADANRFKIVFNEPNPLAASEMEITVHDQNNTALVEWSLEDSRDIASYEVERSTDGRVFRSLFSVKADEGHSNSFTDKYPEAVNYYRIKATNISGDNLYSKIVTYSKSAIEPIITYPNPITEQKLHVYFPVKGDYQLTLTDMKGVTITRKSIRCEEDKHYNIIDLDKAVLPGVYLLHILSLKNNETINEIIIIK